MTGKTLILLIKVLRMLAPIVQAYVNSRTEYEGLLDTLETMGRENRDPTDAEFAESVEESRKLNARIREAADEKEANRYIRPTIKGDTIS